MDYAEFERYVNQADDLAAKNLPAYKLRLRFFTLLGYLVIMAMTVVIGGLGALAYISPAHLILVLKEDADFSIATDVVGDHYG
jgi:hypothetical protein